MSDIVIYASRLQEIVEQIFLCVGVESEASATTASALVEAECQGLASHGVLMLPMYIERIRAGSVSTKTKARIVHDKNTVAVLDAENSLGQASASQAMAMAVERAKKYGLGAVAVKNAFHFGAASRYAIAATQLGCIGIAMCNTRPLMPAPGGAQRVVGNNPLAIGLPVQSGAPVVLDMALSEAAMGKIRVADAAGLDIPLGWATDHQGVPTTSPAEAIKGMLLPAGGAKGFGLAFVIDLICGGLSTGGWGDQVTHLFGDRGVSYNSAHFFLAIDVEHFRPLLDFEQEISTAAEFVRNSSKASGTQRLYTPGERKWQRAQDNDGTITIPAGVASSLRQLVGELELSIPELTSNLE
jgi:LDH2 family malate/lactate/ureidoglycolate dehydrogenase